MNYQKDIDESVRELKHKLDERIDQIQDNFLENQRHSDKIKSRISELEDNITKVRSLCEQDSEKMVQAKGVSLEAEIE